MTYRLGKCFAVVLDELDILMVLYDARVAGRTQVLHGSLLGGPVVFSLWRGQDIVQVIVVEVDRAHRRRGGEHCWN